MAIYLGSHFVPTVCQMKSGFRLVTSKLSNALLCIEPFKPEPSEHKALHYVKSVRLPKVQKAFALKAFNNPLFNSFVIVQYRPSSHLIACTYMFLTSLLYGSEPISSDFHMHSNRFLWISIIIFRYLDFCHVQK